MLFLATDAWEKGVDEWGSVVFGNVRGTGRTTRPRGLGYCVVTLEPWIVAVANSACRTIIVPWHDVLRGNGLGHLGFRVPLPLEGGSLFGVQMADGVRIWGFSGARSERPGGSQDPESRAMSRSA